MIGGHGWVYPREDGAKARCGGPSICGQCAAEKAQKDTSDKLEREILVFAAKAHAEGDVEKLLALASVARQSVIVMLLVCADELEEWAAEKRKPLPQGDQDVEAREAIDQQAIGLDEAVGHLREKAGEIAGKSRQWKF